MTSDNKEVLARELAKTVIKIKRQSSINSSDKVIRQSEFIFLATLINLRGTGVSGVKVSDISSELNMTPAAATHLANSLVEGGYLERMADTRDRRIVLLSETEKGRNIVAEKEQRLLNFFSGLVEYLGEEDSRELIRITSRAFNYFKERKTDNEDKLKT